MSKTRPASTPPRRSPIYCCVPIEFCQPWNHLRCIAQIKELGLGNVAMPSNTFHVGNSEADRNRWKAAFPSLAAQIDATPLFPERPEHGMAAILVPPVEFWLEEVRLCRKLGLKMLIVIAGDAPPGLREAVGRASRPILLTDELMGENTSILSAGLSLEQLRKIDAADTVGHTEAQLQSVQPQPQPPAPASIFDDVESLDFQVMHDWFVARFRAKATRLRAAGARHLCGIEATAQMRLVMEAGGDVPIFELVPGEPVQGLAATRGAAKAGNAAFWGIHAALGYYRAPTDLWTPERLRIAYNLWYAGGAGYFSEPNLAFQNCGSCSGFFTIRASPAIRIGEMESRPFDDPVCVRSREVLADHYRFTQFHDRPAKGPRVKLGVVMGNLDAYAGRNQDRVWMVDHPGFAAGPAEETWHHFAGLYASEPWYVPPVKYYWQADACKPLRYGTPPCGQVDIVPIEAPPRVLQQYGCLVFLGWNTMTPEIYAKLKRYVQGGGRLLMSVPHLDTRTRRDRPVSLINGGDVSDLLGVKVVGPGNTIDEVTFTAQSQHTPYVFPVNTLYIEPAPLANLELAGARVLAHPRDKDDPVLLEHRCGKGFAWLLNTWEYPGKRLDAFITDCLRTIADGEQAEIAVRGENVEYAIYDGSFGKGRPFSVIYLVSRSIYGQPLYPRLVIDGRDIAVRVGGADMRIIWRCGDLVLSPFDRFVKVTDIAARRGGWSIRLAAEPGEHRVQIDSLGAQIRRATVDGKACRIQRDQEGVASIHCRLHGNAHVELLTGP